MNRRDYTLACCLVERFLPCGMKREVLGLKVSLRAPGQPCQDKNDYDKA